MSIHLPIIRQCNKIKTHIYSELDTSQILKTLNHLSRYSFYIKDPIILLTDVHHKPLLETPYSSVILTPHHISLAMTSPSQNCGMSFILTPFDKKDMSPGFVQEMMRLIRKKIPLTNSGPVISIEDVFEALGRGAVWAAKKYGLPTETCDNIECNGNLLGKNEISVSGLAEIIPDEILELTRRRFGIIGGGNHFLEIQVIDEIADKNIARIWGLKKDQIVIMFHTGSDALGAYLGRLFAYRKKTSIKNQILLYKNKIKYHLLLNSPKTISKRIAYYFIPKTFSFINPDIPEGKRVLLAINSSANLGFANRMVVFSHIRDAIMNLTENKKLDMRLLYDCSHNSIYRENINGKSLWAHRHNACRVYPRTLLNRHSLFSQTGQPVILPGTNQTSSFICAGQEGAAVSHYTVDHGLGAIQKNYEKTAPIIKTRKYNFIYNYSREMPEKIPILSDAGVNRAVEALNKADIIKTVARLRPLATLKGPKSKIV